MSRYKPYIYFVSIMIFGLIAFYFVSEGYYPIALVGRQFISARAFSNEYRAASIYYQNMKNAYKPVLAGKDELTSREIEASVMDQLIEDAIVRDGARQEAGPNLNSLVEAKLEKFTNDINLKKAAALLYGLDEGSFSQSILIPQAERDILAARLFLRGEKFDEWLSSAKKSARVIIFSPQFQWDGERVAVN